MQIALVFGITQILDVMHISHTQRLDLHFLDLGFGPVREQAELARLREHTDHLENVIEDHVSFHSTEIAHHQNLTFFLK